MHFSLKMSRLVLICGPIVAIMCSIWLGFLVDFAMEPFFLFLGKKYAAEDAVFAGTNGTNDKTDPAAKGKAVQQPSAKGKKAAPAKNNGSNQDRLKSEKDLSLAEWDEDYRPGGVAQIKRKAKMTLINVLPDDAWDGLCAARNTWKRHTLSHVARIIFSLVLIYWFFYVSNAKQTTNRFLTYCDSTAEQMSSPTVLKRQQRQDGSFVIIDDAMQGYRWMKEKTPKDSRILAWWDYGYQITGIGERTSLADGNTWNHEHIATLGRLLSGGQKQSHNVIRHLADYVLIMTGAVNDDLSISTHFARIGNSVFPDHCGDEDPNCNKFNFHGGDRYQPTPMMKKSLVYNLYMHGKNSDGKADPRCFQHVWQSSNDQMRIFKVVNVSEESRAWVANNDNRLCDAPGSWYCVGQYPPALKKFLTKRGSFAQVEDFNKKGEQSAYTKMINKQQHGGEM